MKNSTPLYLLTLITLLLAACASAPPSPTPSPEPDAPIADAPKPKPERRKIVAVDNDNDAYEQGEQLEQAARRYGEMVEELFEINQDEINQCYLRELKKNPQLGGHLVVNLVVSPDGKLRQDPVFTNNTLQNPKIEDCVLKILKELRYPEPYNKDYTKVERALRFGAF